MACHRAWKNGGYGFQSRVPGPQGHGGAGPLPGLHVPDSHKPSSSSHPRRNLPSVHPLLRSGPSHVPPPHRLLGQATSPADTALFPNVVTLTARQDSVAAGGRWTQDPGGLGSNPSSASHCVSGLGKWHDHSVPQFISRTGYSAPLSRVAGERTKACEGAAAGCTGARLWGACGHWLPSCGRQSCAEPGPDAKCV